MSLVDYTRIYDPDTDFDARYTLATAAAIVPWLRPGDRVLELGCATGLMTSALSAAGAAVTGVDRSEPYLRRARSRELPGARFVTADMTDLPELGAHDHVLLCSVLHELPDPEAVLRDVRARHLRPGALVHVSLQNPHSLHRIVALEMGLIDSLEELAERGERYGTTRLWSADDLAALCARAGLRERERTGVMLKPLPNAAMAALPDDVLDGFEGAARHLPQFAAMNLLTLEAG